MTKSGGKWKTGEPDENCDQGGKEENRMDLPMDLKTIWRTIAAIPAALFYLVTYQKLHPYIYNIQSSNSFDFLDLYPQLKIEHPAKWIDVLSPCKDAEQPPADVKFSKWNLQKPSFCQRPDTLTLLQATISTSPFTIMHPNDSLRPFLQPWHVIDDTGHQPSQSSMQQAGVASQHVVPTAAQTHLTPEHPPFNIFLHNHASKWLT